MIGFWLPAALLALLAILFVLWPLRAQRAAAMDRRQQNLAIFAERRSDLEAELAAGDLDDAAFRGLLLEAERALLDDAANAAEPAEAVTGGGGRVLLAAAALVPLLALALYADWGLGLGALADVALARDLDTLEAVERGDEASHQGADMAGMTERLRQRLEANPDDADGWFLLGRTQLNTEAYAGAAESFARVSALVPDAPAPLIYRTQALYLAADRELTAEVRASIDAVQRLVPDEPITTELLAVDAFGRGDWVAAADGFERVLRQGVDDPGRQRFLAGALVRSRELAGLPPIPAAGQAGTPGVRVQLDAAPGVLDDLPEGAAIFVLARPAGGPRMPLAVRRFAPADLPLDVRLTDADAMNPALALSGAQAVEVVARLSLSGTATPGEDDLEARAGPLTPGPDAGVVLTLGAAAAPAPRAPVAAETTGSSVRVLVELAPGLEAPAGATLFVFARAVDGPPMPLAVARLTAAELPALVTLDDSMAMMAGRGLSSAAAVEVVARISASGAPTAAPGDLEGALGPLDPRSADRVVNVLIDRVLGD